MIVALLLCALALIVHEAGHVLAARMLGFTASDDLTIALAGPLASFLLAALATPFSPRLAFFSQLCGLISLLPIPLPIQDGWRAYRALQHLEHEGGPVDARLVEGSG